MKSIITSLVRHALTALAGFAAFAGAHDWINPEDAPAVNASALSLTDALVVIVVAVISRLLMTYGGKFFKDLGDGGGTTVVLLCMGLVFSGFFLSSCTPSGEPAVPIRACYVNEYGRVCYGTDGLSVDYQGKN